MRTLDQLMDLTGRCALITGGAGFLGLAIGEALVELGARVAILDRQEEQCHERAVVLSNHGHGGAISIVADLLDEDETRKAAAEAASRLGRLDIVVHAAGYVGTTQVEGWAVPFESQTVAAWDQALRVNVTSAFALVQHLKPVLEESGHGSVILIASIYGVVGTDPHIYEGTQMVNPAGYVVSKGAVVQLTRYLATTLAPRVRVNSISPGGIWRNQPDSFHQKYRDRTPLGRMAAEEDFKGAIAYLASDLSAYVTGHNLLVDGGWTAW